jgi:hypothetical protein
LPSVLTPLSNQEYRIFKNTDFISFLKSRYQQQQKPPLQNDIIRDPFIGIWKDRKDMKDDKWLRKVRIVNSAKKRVSAIPGFFGHCCSAAFPLDIYTKSSYFFLKVAIIWRDQTCTQQASKTSKTT